MRSTERSVPSSRMTLHCARFLLGTKRVDSAPMRVCGAADLAAVLRPFLRLRNRSILPRADSDLLRLSGVCRIRGSRTQLGAECIRRCSIKPTPMLLSARLRSHGHKLLDQSRRTAHHSLLNAKPQTTSSADTR